MQEPYRKGSSDSILSSSLAGNIARCFLKRRQRHRWAGLLSCEKPVDQDADSIPSRGRQHGSHARTLRVIVKTLGGFIIASWACATTKTPNTHSTRMDRRISFLIFSPSSAEFPLWVPKRRQVYTQFFRSPAL